jgi:hypothetical protein
MVLPLVEPLVQPLVQQVKKLLLLVNDKKLVTVS